MNLGHWFRTGRNRWTALTPEEAEQTRQHVFEAAFPESIDTLREISLKHGFDGVTSLCRDSAGLFELLCFRARNLHEKY